MKLDISYKIEKDIENFKNGFRAKNNLNRTKFEQGYLDLHGSTLDDTKIKDYIRSFIESEKINVEVKTSGIEAGWSAIQDEFIKRCKALFKLKYPVENLNAYLATNSRCTYNIPEGYFFVYLNSKEPNRNIMHELLHFYTYEAFYNKLKETGVSDEKYNEIKESLTELLNIEFADLMNGAVDKGYSQH